MQSEARIQQECVVWFWNKYPEYRGLLFEVNNNSEIPRKWITAKLYELLSDFTVKKLRSIISGISKAIAIDGSKHKALGRVKGVSDLILLAPNNPAFGLEFKALKGRQTNEQVLWQKTVEKHGHYYYLINSVDQFKAIIYEAFGGKN